MASTASALEGVLDLLERVVVSGLANHIKDYPGIAALIALALVIGGARLFRAMVTPEQEPDWTTIDPGDPAAVAKAYDNLHIVATLGRELDTDPAETIAQFRDQLATRRQQIQIASEARNTQKAEIRAQLKDRAG